MKKRMIRRWWKIGKGTPAYKEGYRWFDMKTMKHFKKLPANAVTHPLTKYSWIKHA